MSFPQITSKMVPFITELADVPEDLDVHYEDGCSYVRVPLAESEDGQWLVVVDVGYRTNYSQSPCSRVRPLDFVMFGYEITLFDQTNSVAYQTMDPHDTREAIPKEMRPLVIDIACNCYRRLLGECNPDYIFRSTWMMQPSDAALKKHLEATKTLTQSGYTVVREGTDQDGCKFWLLGRDGLDHSSLDQPEIVGIEGGKP